MIKQFVIKLTRCNEIHGWEERGKRRMEGRDHRKGKENRNVETEVGI